MAKARNKYPRTPETSGADMNSFARDPWIAGRCGHWEAAADLPGLPAWLGQASRERLEWMAGQEDEAPNVVFFRQLCAMDHARTPQGRLAMMAMMACMGWNEVVDDLIADGVPLSLELPGDQWQWVETQTRTWRQFAGVENTSEGKCRVDALSVAVAACIPDSAAAPLHLGRAASIEAIVRAGGDPNAMPGRLVRELVETGKLGRLLVRLGLKASTDAQGEPFIGRLMSTDTTLAQNQRNLMLEQLIGCGMGAHEQGCKPLMEYISSNVFGINALKVAIRHPDQDGIRAQALEHEHALRSRAASRRATPTAEEIERIDLVDKLLGAAKMGVATAMPEQAPTAKPRL